MLGNMKNEMKPDNKFEGALWPCVVGFVLLIALSGPNWWKVALGGLVGWFLIGLWEKIKPASKPVEPPKTSGSMPVAHWEDNEFDR